MLNGIDYKCFRKHQRQFEKSKMYEVKEYKALFLTLFGRLGPSSRIRAFQYIPILEKYNIHCDIFPLIDDYNYEVLLGLRSIQKWKLTLLKFKLGLWTPVKRLRHILSARKYDVVYLQKDVLLPPFFAILRFLNPNIVFDLDDALYAPHPTVKYKRFSIGGMFLLLRRKYLNNILKKSRTVTVTVKHLAQYVRQFNNNVHILTGPIDTDYFKPIASNCNKEIVIGWMGSPTTAPFLKDILPALKEVIKVIPECKLKIIGASHFDTDGIPVIFEKWSLKNERKQLSTFDIGIMPLRDNEWCKGKGGLKILQYFVMNRPVVCSPVGVNNELVSHGKNGFHAKNNKDWVKYLVLLAKDPMLRVSMGLEGRKLVLNKFNLKKAGEVFANILRG